MAAPLKIGELFISQGVITEKQLQIALDHQKVTGDILGDLLIKLGFVTAQEFARTIATQSGIGYFDLSESQPDEEALRMIPKETSQKVGMLPLSVLNGQLSIGITNPSNIVAVDTVTKLTGKAPIVYIIDNDQFQDTLEKAYFFITHPIQQRMEEITATLRQMTGAVPGTLISGLVDLILMDGIRKMATDIHITPADDVTNVFYRIDGVLQHGHCIQRIVHNGLVSRIKVMSQLDIAEQRLPQDGAFTYDFLTKHLEVRISTIPSIYGENLVMRLLAGTGSLLRLEALGVSERDIQQLRKLTRKSYGIILVVGPTGSGKTTTLYAALRELNRLERNILTVEDPVEYRLSFVKQTQVNEKAGYSFSLAARNFMRQDPDVMLLGEIRDEDTAQMAIRSAITGHLVLSTMHTNDAATAIPRLLDLKVDNFLLSSALVAVLAQRLVRKICPHCREEHEFDADELELLSRHGFETKRGYRGKGCNKCGGSGYIGRISICEILVVDSRIQQLIFEGASTGTILEAAAAEGMTSLLHDGISKVAKGITTLSEVLRVAG
ncbi:MAG: GspE/PulE family protein [Desulfuromonadaceae bacterium]|nr:GspE/PulE family protein [Desulfuromonadaceae bacterium]MDD2848802.1 GspE/PulE family protein [Desulfuromonadaceae bacterium]MDD4130452.1 GspE/PulE family protein [Desulfuromonadaceae bacterium]